ESFPQAFVPRLRRLARAAACFEPLPASPEHIRACTCASSRYGVTQLEKCMIKVAMIGAGSVVFSKNLTGDILSYPEFKNATLSYMDIDRERLEVGANLCRKVGKALGANPTIQATLDRREALAG